MKSISFIIGQFFLSVLLILPNTYMFSRMRAKFYKKLGAKIGHKTLISANVRITGNFSLGDNSSIAQNCTISGMKYGVHIGENVMIAPNVVIIAFNHGTVLNDGPMVYQDNIEKPIQIEDDVWIGANVTIGCGVRISKGTVVGANSFINKDTEPNSIVGGVPAKHLKYRI